MAENQKKKEDELLELIDLAPLPELVDEEITVGLDGVLDALPVVSDEMTTDDDDTQILPDKDLPTDTYADETWTGEDVSALDAGIIDMQEIVTDLDEAATDADDSTDTAPMDEWLDDLETDVSEIDGGEEGPLTDDIYEIDTANWANLDDDMADDAVEDESIFDTMKRLDLSIDEEIVPPKETKRSPKDAEEVFYLGPNNGDLQAVLFHDGLPIGVGDGLYLSGADQMLHAVTSATLGDMVGTSLAGKKGTLFIGTASQGAFRTADRYRTFHPINRWFTEGLSRDESMRINTCSTAFYVAGQNTKNGFRLLGWTGEGQLYSSLDYGDTWTGPLLKGRSCEALKASAASDQVLVLAASRTEVGVLLFTRDLASFTVIPLPPELADHCTPSNTNFDVAAEVIAVGVDIPGIPLFISSDRGNNWQIIETITGVTALVIDPDEPNWLAAAVVQRDGDTAVCISDDRGKSWQQVFTQNSKRDQRCLINALVLSNDGARSLIALTEGDAYLIVFDQKERTH